jgi:hypothetical protein
MTLPSESSEWSAGRRLGTLRSFGALILGAAGGALACGIYYGAETVTGGAQVRWIVAIAGLLVGAGVRLGSRARGGMAFQGLAMFLTYASVVGTHGADIRDALQQASIREEVQPQATASAGSGAPKKRQPSWETLSTPERVLVYAVTIGIVCGLTVTAPLLAENNLVELGALAFALICAWFLNRSKAELSTGPLEMDIRHGHK